MSVLETFEKWKSFLRDRVEQAEAAGMSQEKIADTAYHIGSYLAHDIDPENREERLLQELWNAGDENEKHALASMMVKLVHQE